MGQEKYRYYSSMAGACLLAILAHGILIFLLVFPTGDKHNPIAPTITITLEPIPPAKPPQQPIAETKPELQAITPPPVNRLPAANPPPATVEPLVQTPEIQPPPSAVDLMEQAGRIARNTQKKNTVTTLRLGQTPAVKLPQNWTRELLTAKATMFGSLWLPDKTKILDRWKSPDGTHEVKVKAPDGYVYCGRAAPYNPLEPLVESVMLFRRC